MKMLRHVVLPLALWLALPVASAAPPSYALQVDGLACPFCAYGIEKKLSAIEGVASVAVDIQQGRVVVTMKDGVTLDEAPAKQAVKEAGFSLRKFERVQATPQDASGGQAK